MNAGNSCALSSIEKLQFAFFLILPFVPTPPPLPYSVDQILPLATHTDPPHTQQWDPSLSSMDMVQPLAKHTDHPHGKNFFSVFVFVYYLFLLPYNHKPDITENS